MICKNLGPLASGKLHGTFGKPVRENIQRKVRCYQFQTTRKKEEKYIGNASDSE